MTRRESEGAWAFRPMKESDEKTGLQARATCSGPCVRTWDTRKVDDQNARG